MEATKKALEAVRQIELRLQIPLLEGTDGLSNNQKVAMDKALEHIGAANLILKNLDRLAQPNMKLGKKYRVMLKDGTVCEGVFTQALEGAPEVDIFVIAEKDKTNCINSNLVAGAAELK